MARGHVRVGRPRQDGQGRAVPDLDVVYVPAGLDDAAVRRSHLPADVDGGLSIRHRRDVVHAELPVVVNDMLEAAAIGIVPYGGPGGAVIGHLHCRLITVVCVLHPQPTPEHQCGPLDIRAVNGGGGEIGRRHATWIGAPQIVAVDIGAGMGGRGITVVAMRNAELPLPISGPARVITRVVGVEPPGIDRIRTRRAGPDLYVINAPARKVQGRTSGPHHPADIHGGLAIRHCRDIVHTVLPFIIAQIV